MPRPHSTNNFAKKKFLYRLSRSDYEKQWGKDYVKPGIGSRILATLLRYMPKVGPFKGLAFNNPTPKTEDLYFKSINTTVDLPSGGSATFTVQSITSNTQLTLSSNVTATSTAVVAKRQADPNQANYIVFSSIAEILNGN